jgi:poly-gamma-glutamate synthesis protein (capsule biosynthesis protein)
VENTLAEIEALDSQVDQVIVFAHWGSEYETVANPAQVSLAQAFVESGADLVVGAHPHVTQNRGEYSQVPLVYSLGNFVFDQYFESGVRCGEIIKIRINQTQIEILETIDTYLESNGTTRIANVSEC